MPALAPSVPREAESARYRFATLDQTSINRQDARAVQAAPPEASYASRRGHAIAAAVIGNAFEWFDFVVYGYFAATIAKLFFPLRADAASFLFTLATFGITFFMRPLGAIMLGVYADRHGRKAALTLTIMLMMLGTAVIAVLPTYSVIGSLAPILMVIARMLQGFSAGGEFGSATAFLAEQDAKRRGFLASLQFASQGLTTVFAGAFGVLLAGMLSPEQIDQWGWRVPFVFGLLIGPVAYYLRICVDETREFRSLQHDAGLFLEALSDGKRRLLIAVGVVVLCTVVMYTTLFMPSFAIRELGLPAAGSFFATLVCGAIQMILAPIFGAISDKQGRLPIMVAAAFAILFTCYPMFMWMVSTPSLPILLIVQAFMGVLGAAYMGPLPALLADIFPTRIRSTGLSVSYSFAVAIFGGCAPFISAWLIAMTGSKLAPSFYLMLAAAISLGALLMQRRLRE
jgi:MHS family proline/betaine transporter-like MFS transporter